jgi:transcriptional regulator with XRE-family HTH domain
MEPTAQFVAAIVGPRIRRIRREIDMSQEALADIAEYHRTQMTRLEWGERLPHLDTVIKLAGGLGVPPCELLDGIVWERGGHGRSGRMVELGRGPDA